MIYTDGACSGNPGPGGWGFAQVDREEDCVRYYEAGRNSQTTNNQMELTAAINALTYVKENGIGAVVTVHTDSTYTMNAMNDWAHGWKKNGWRKKDKKPIENPELIQTLYALCHESNMNVVFVKVKAHQKKGSKYYDKFNDFVDQLAVGVDNPTI